MKIDPKIGTNLGQQDLVTSPKDQLSGVQADQVEAFEVTDVFAPGFSEDGANRGDIAIGFSLLTGGRNESFGVALATPADPPVAPESEEEGFWDIPPYSWLADGYNWLDEHPPDFQGAFKWLGEKVVDGFLAAGEGIADGIRWTAGEIKDGAEAVGGAIKDAASAVGDAISDAFDW